MGEDRDERIVRRLAGDVVDFFSPKLRPPSATTELVASSLEEKRVQALQSLLMSRTAGVKCLEPGAGVGVQARLRLRLRPGSPASTLPA